MGKAPTTKKMGPVCTGFARSAYLRFTYICMFRIVDLIYIYFFIFRIVDDASGFKPRRLF